MAKNKESKGFNLTGVYDKNERTITYIEKENITTYSLDEYLDKFDGLEISLGGSSQIDLIPFVEE